MYMRVQYNFAQKKDWRDYVDLSRYTGMEVEHGGNTAHYFDMNSLSNLGHFNPNSEMQSNFNKFTNAASSTKAKAFE